MKIVIIVQARMTSTRLLGKVLKKVLNKSLLEYQIERLKRVKLVDQIVIATTTNETDQSIVNLCEYLLISYLKSSEEDVLERYYQVAKKHHADLDIVG
jgi:spore coat polysaccharide biosynthesis protein SpsF